MLPSMNILNEYPNRGDRVSREEITLELKIRTNFLEFNVPEGG